MSTENIASLAGALASLVGIITTALAVNRPQKRLSAMKEAIELKKTAPPTASDDLERFIVFNAAKLGAVWWRDPMVLVGVVVLAAGVAVGVLIGWLEAFTPAGATGWLWMIVAVYVVVGGAMAFYGQNRARSRYSGVIAASPVLTSGQGQGGSASATPDQPAPPTTTEQTSSPA